MSQDQIINRGWFPLYFYFFFPQQFLMDNPFAQLRELVAGLNSQEEFKSHLVEIVALISMINKMYIDVSFARNQTLLELQKVVKNVHAIHSTNDSYLYTCQIMAEDIQNIEIPPFNLDGLNIQPREEFMAAAGMTEEEAAKLHPDDFMKQQMQHEIKRYKELKQQCHELHAKSTELKAKLVNVNKLFAPIMTKICEMDEVLKNFKEKYLNNQPQ